MQVVGFTWEDLSANQQGQLGDMQRKRLQQTRRQALMWVIGGFLMMPLCLLPIIRQLVFVALNATSLSVPSMGFNLLLALIPFGVLWLALRQLDSINHDLYVGTIHVIEGMVLRDDTPKIQRAYRGVLAINNIKLHVSQPVLLSFIEAASYRVYYTPHAKILLGAEAQGDVN
jgi:hypothetical protein